MAPTWAVSGLLYLFNSSPELDGMDVVTNMSILGFSFSHVTLFYIKHVKSL